MEDQQVNNADIPKKCNTNSDCEDGEVCKNGKCVKDTGTEPTDPPPIPPL